MNKVVLYCRPGFEKECAAEITDKAAKREVFGFARVKENSGYVVFECYQPDDAEKLVRELPFSSLIFARQMFVAGELLKDLSPEDRITPIVGMLQGVVEKGGDLRVEVADTNESKELMKFCRKFTVPLRAALREAGVLTNYETPKRGRWACWGCRALLPIWGCWISASRNREKPWWSPRLPGRWVPPWDRLVKSKGVTWWGSPVGRKNVAMR
jgi:23S rRNA C2498 (ribose-2'-O)-methylase RlmM